jgi:hypothetical protein
MLHLVGYTLEWLNKICAFFRREGRFMQVQFSRACLTSEGGTDRFSRYVYHILLYSLGSIFYQCIYGCIPVQYCNLCIFIVMSMYSYCMFMYLHRASWHSSATPTEVFPCFFLSCKANARV